MKALLIGIVILAAAVFAALPPHIAGFGLGWWGDVLVFLRGGLPVIAVFIAAIAVFIGIADMKDRAEAKKEEEAAAKEGAAGENTEPDAQKK
ncbi:MAG: hypothetical protein LBL44_01730 [Treponema sp.]|jgi:hypothetical protein|nr:hypothetical protein [Treponema sp.]